MDEGPGGRHFVDVFGSVDDRHDVLSERSQQLLCERRREDPIRMKQATPDIALKFCALKLVFMFGGASAKAPCAASLSNSDDLTCEIFTADAIFCREVKLVFRLIHDGAVHVLLLVATRWLLGAVAEDVDRDVPRQFCADSGCQRRAKCALVCPLPNVILRNLSYLPCSLLYDFQCSNVTQTTKPFSSWDAQSQQQTAE